MPKFYAVVGKESGEEPTSDPFDELSEQYTPSQNAPRISFAKATKQAEQSSQDERITIGRDGKAVFSRHSRRDIQSIPRQEFLLKHLLHVKAVSMIFGESGTGKTFWALHLATCVALGLDWFGKRVKAGRVLYIYAEGQSQLNDRLMAWEQHYGRVVENIDFLPFEVHLVNEQATLLATIDDMPEKPVLLVIDTYSNCTIGLSQNEQEDVAQALAVAHRIKRIYGCHVMLIHHTNKSDQFNGSQAFKNHVDTMIEIKQEKRGDPIIMRHEKNRDIPPFESISLALKVLSLGVDEEASLSHLAA
jgi:RecA-family ATPase